MVQKVQEDYETCSCDSARILIIFKIMKVRIPKAMVLFHVLDHCEVGVCNCKDFYWAVGEKMS
jgi:hypothetical protein